MHERLGKLDWFEYSGLFETMLDDYFFMDNFANVEDNFLELTDFLRVVEDELMVGAHIELFEIAVESLKRLSVVERSHL